MNFFDFSFERPLIHLMNIYLIWIRYRIILFLFLAILDLKFVKMQEQHWYDSLIFLNFTDEKMCKRWRFPLKSIQSCSCILTNTLGMIETQYVDNLHDEPKFYKKNNSIKSSITSKLPLFIRFSIYLWDHMYLTS